MLTKRTHYQSTTCSVDSLSDSEESLPFLLDREENLISRKKVKMNHHQLPHQPNQMKSNLFALKREECSIPVAIEEIKQSNGAIDPAVTAPLSSNCAITKEHLQPYVVAFNCSLCTQGYYCVVYENPWYTIVRQVCPHCQKIQIPTLDINLPINARELDPNVEYFYNEVKDEEFLDLSAVDDCEDFSLELTEPVLKLVFADHFKDDSNRITVSGEEKPLQEVVNLRLLALVTHAVRCNSIHHSNVKQTNLCRNAKILLLHMVNCKKLDCLFPLCPPCRPVLSYLSAFPEEATTKGLKLENKLSEKR